MTYTIVVGSDLSPQSDAALDLAISLAESKSDSQVLIVHVIKEAVPTYDDELGVLEPTRLRTSLQAIAADRETPVRVTHQIEYGNPATKLIEVAEEEAADLIIVGTHGNTGLMSLLMGSVAEAVIRRSDIPVIALKTPVRESARQHTPKASSVLSNTLGNESP